MPQLTEEQLKAVEDLTKTLLKTYRTLADIVGHRDIDTMRRLAKAGAA